MTPPLITIGITAYNAQKTIERAIRSAQAQTWPHKEIIVVDDESTDKTRNIISRLFPQIRLIALNDNQGVAIARNTIIENAQGEFIAFFDDDDQSAPDRLQKQYDRLTSYERTHANGAPIIVHTARTQIYPDGTTRIEPTMGCDIQKIAPNGLQVAERILTGKPSPNIFGSTATCSQMARTIVYKTLGGFDPAFRRSEDTDFNVRAAIAGAHFAGLSEQLVTQTMTHSSEKKLKDELEFNMKLLNKHAAFINTVSNGAFCMEWVDAKYDLMAGDKKIFLQKFLTLLARHPILTLQRVLWAMPNTEFNIAFSKFHNDKQPKS